MKKIVALLLTATMALGLAACGGGSSASSAASSAAPAESSAAESTAESTAEPTGDVEYEWTLAIHLAEQSQQVIALKQMSDDIFERTNGRMKINVVFGAALGGQRESIEMTNLGTVEMGFGEAGLYANYCPEFGVLNLPFLFESEDQYIEVAQGGVGDTLNKIMDESTNLYNLAWMYGGDRDVIPRKKLRNLTTLRDLRSVHRNRRSMLARSSRLVLTRHRLQRMRCIQHFNRAW